MWPNLETEPGLSWWSTWSKITPSPVLALKKCVYVSVWSNEDLNAMLNLSPLGWKYSCLWLMGHPSSSEMISWKQISSLQKQTYGYQWKGRGRGVNWEFGINIHRLLSSVQFSSVQSLSHVRLFATPWIAACQPSLSITNSWSSLKLMSIESMMPSNYLILCCPLLLPPSIFPSIRVFSNESVHKRWPKYWSFSISSSNDFSGLIFFRID